MIGTIHAMQGDGRVIKSFLLDQVEQEGFAVLDGLSPEQIISAASRIGSVRGTWEVIKAKGKSDSDPWSLSGKYGFDRFPWHTDGAISLDPPWLVILYCADPGSMYEPTELIALPETELAGIFGNITLATYERSGRCRYLPALFRRGGDFFVRWDPRICSPTLGTKSKGMAETIEAMNATYAVNWLQGRVLVINNHHLLHRRPAVPESSNRKLGRLYVYRKEVGG